MLVVSDLLHEVVYLAALFSTNVGAGLLALGDIL